MKISFDFDDTLSRPEVQHYAEMFIKDGHEVWIVTSRMSNERAQNPSWNKDLYFVADCVGIENIHFCNLQPKHEFFEDENFDIHLDDDPDDVEGINLHTDTQAFLYVPTARLDVLKSINQYINES